MTLGQRHGRFLLYAPVHLGATLSVVRIHSLLMTSELESYGYTSAYMVFHAEGLAGINL